MRKSKPLEPWYSYADIFAVTIVALSLLSSSGYFTVDEKQRRSPYPINFMDTLLSVLIIVCSSPNLYLNLAEIWRAGSSFQAVRRKANSEGQGKAVGFISSFLDLRHTRQI